MKNYDVLVDLCEWHNVLVILTEEGSIKNDHHTTQQRLMNRVLQAAYDVTYRNASIKCVQYRAGKLSPIHDVTPRCLALVVQYLKHFRDQLL
jgi:hypothetical protein